jgi:hypothetical protein
MVFNIFLGAGLHTAKRGNYGCEVLVVGHGK